MGYFDGLGALGADLAEVRAIIDACVRDGGPAVAEALAPLAASTGKMLRPGILCLCARMGRFDGSKVYPLAAAVELLHLATLVHDDVIDDSPLRRGQPAVHARIGRKGAVLAGDWLFARCFELAADRTSPDNAVRLSRAVSLMCRTEIEQDLSRFRPEPLIRPYLRRIMGKTAVLFSMACQAGASEGGLGRGVQERLRRAGYAIGMAFQIVDDVLDYSGDPAALRKPVGGDLREGLSTLPLLLALRRDPEGKLGFVARDPASMRGRDREIIAITAELGGVGGALEWARRYTARALRDIGSLPASDYRDSLASIASSLLVRAS